jgi:hypothetical protein
MFCAYCDEMIAGKSFIFDGEEYCSRECLEAAKSEVEGDVEGIDKETEENWEEESDDEEEDRY